MSSLHFSVTHHVTECSDLVDLWVIKIKKSLWSFAHLVLRLQMNRSRSENMWKVCLFYSQLKIVWLLNMADISLGKFARCAKVCGLFILIVLSGCWLVGQGSSDHMTSVYTAGYSTLIQGQLNKEIQVYFTLQFGPLFLQIHSNLNPLKVFTSSC